MLRVESLRHRQRVADGVNPEGGALQHSDRCARQGGDALGVEVVGEDGGNELRDPVAVERLVAYETAA
jgi:hypothetical protein